MSAFDPVIKMHLISLIDLNGLARSRKLLGGQIIYISLVLEGNGRRQWAWLINNMNGCLKNTLLQNILIWYQID